MKSNQAHQNTFQVFVDEHSPEEAIEVDRIWKKKLNQQKNKRFTIIMLSAVAVMVVMFALLIKLFHTQPTKAHYQIDEITYKDTKYTYLQSSVPHLKFLIPPEDTKQIKILKVSGIIYPEIIAWIDSNVAPSHKVLFIPNENIRVNVLGITLGYYLRRSAGGILTIGVEGIKFKDMTEKNIELINKDLQEPMPIELVTLKDLQVKQYDLIVLESSGFHSQLNNTDNSKIIVIRRQSVDTTIMRKIFLSHRKLQILRGQTNEQIRALPSQYGYSLVPYVPTEKSDDNYILLVPESVSDIQMCQQTNQQLKAKPEVRNLVQRLKNQTFFNTSVLYAINSSAGLQSVSNLPISKIFSINSSLTSSRIIPIKGLEEFEKEDNSIYILTSDIALTVSLEKNDKLYVEINREDERSKIGAKFQDFRVSIVSPFNNKGCFYPPALIERSNASKYFLYIRNRREPSPQNR